MQKIIGVTELQRRFKAVFDEVVKDRVPYVLARGSRPEAALISYRDFLRFQEWDEREKDARRRWDELMAKQAELSGDWSEDEVEADVAATIAEVRAERRTKRQAQAR